MRAVKGFTLMELLVVVAVVGILAAVSIPYYNDYVLRGKLPEGQSALSDGRVRMEQYFQDNRTYAVVTTANATSHCPVEIQWPITTQNFSYACSNLSTTTYTLTATGLNTISQFVFTIDQGNNKVTTGAPSGWGAPQNCWLRRKGSC